MRTYLSVWILVTALCLCAAALISVIIDPYAVHGWINQAGLNITKPHAGTHGQITKRHMLERSAPLALILGNSRAEVGFDPQLEVWPAAVRPVFNAALPGTGPMTSLQMLRHALAAAKLAGRAPPRLVVWGVDFIDFLPNPPSAPSALSAPGAASDTPAVGLGALAVEAEGQSWSELMKSTLTLDALLDSVSTVLAQRDPYSPHVTALGFNPMRDYERIAAREGYQALFRQKSESHVRNLLPHVAIPPTLANEQFEEFDAVRKVLALCAHNGIELKLVLYPYHTQFLAAVRLTGRWAEFEAWKSALVRTVEQESLRLVSPVPVWDFARYNKLTAERVPLKSDRQATMWGYWEAGHFKQALGDQVLARVLAPDAVDDEFGLRLHTGNLQVELTAQRQRAEEHTASHAQAVAQSADLVVRARSPADARSDPLP